MLSKKQKLSAMAALTVLVVLAAVLNFEAMRREPASGEETREVLALTEGETVRMTEPAAGSLTFVAAYKVQREQTRQEETRYLETILQDEKTDDATRRAAQEQLMEMAGHCETELAIETLLEAKGFTGVAVAVQSDVINIIVEAGTLEDSQVAQILTIAMREGGVKAENVKIIPAIAKDS